MQLQMEQMSGYLVARFTGAGPLRDVSRQLKSLAEHCKLTNNDKLLIDTSGFEATIGFMDRIYVGESWVIFARNGVKVAIVATPEQLYPQSLSFAAYLAQNRGVNTESFTDFQTAEEWLLK